MKKSNLILLGLAVALVLSAAIVPAAAYFTTYAEARGGYEIDIAPTDIEEEFYSWTKHVVITCDEDGQPVYVRARAYAGSQYELQYSGDNWSYNPSDGFFYYGPILNPGESTSELLVHIDNIPEDPSENDDFNVVVIYECTPVQYDEDGNPYPDWDLALEGGGE